MKALIVPSLLLCLAVVVSCKRVDKQMEIKETRAISSRAAAPTPIISSAVRFRDDTPDPATQPSQKSPLTWTTPDGWKEAPAETTSTVTRRLINLRFGPNGEGECYLSAMPGAAGGAKANIDRWRGQMGLKPLTAEEFAALPTKKSFLNRESLFVQLDGDFKGVGATDAQKDFRLIGLLQEAPEFTLFIKITGPKAVVEQNEGAFEQFVQSIGIDR